MSSSDDTLESGRNRGASCPVALFFAFLARHAMRHGGEHCKDVEGDIKSPQGTAQTGRRQDLRRAVQAGGRGSRFTGLTHVKAGQCSTKASLSWMISGVFRGSGDRTVSART